MHSLRCFSQVTRTACGPADIPARDYTLEDLASPSCVGGPAALVSVSRCHQLYNGEQVFRILDESEARKISQDLGRV